MPEGGTKQRKLAAIMFTDMVGYSALAQRDEKLALELLAEHHRLLRPLFPKFGGREIKTTGDGFLVEFASALEATQCAIEIQRALVQHNASTSAERRIHIRIGIHVGDVVLREADIIGDGVNIAARIEPLAEVGGICLSRPVHDQVANKLDAPLIKLDSPQLKNIQTPMDVYRVVLPWQTQAKGEGGMQNAETSVSGRPLPSSQTRWYMPAVLVIVGLNLFLFLKFGLHFGSKNSPTKDRPTATTTSSDPKSIAVLPFVNMSADKADEYLSDGMTEELLNVLTKVKGLRVPGRSSCFAFKGKNEEGIFRKVGEQLHVTAVLEGSVRKAGNQLRITAQLINVADGFHLWSETYDRDMMNIFAIQSDVAQKVAGALKIQLGVEETQSIAKKPTENTEAYKLYLQGRYLWNRRTAENLKKAIQTFNDAIGKDPSYALAHAGLADCYDVLSEYSELSQRETLPRARAAALRALELDSSLAGPHATLADVKMSEWDWVGAEAEFLRAIELNPNYDTAHYWFSNLLVVQGRYDEALTEMKRAQEIYPLSPIINSMLGEKLCLAGKVAMAVEVLQKQIALDPLFVPAHRQLGFAYFTQGRLPEAIAEFETVHRLDGSGTYALEHLGFAYARAQRTDEAHKTLDQMMELQRRGSDYRVGIALVQHAIGEDESALDSLDKAVEEHAGHLDWLAFHPYWKNLRPHPRAQSILKRMNLVK